MKPTIDHIILTRFNLPSKGVESLVRAQDGWLRSRQELFEKYCLPSIRQQTRKDFTWVIYFDPHSPQWLKERIGQLGADRSFIPVFRESVSPAELLYDLRAAGAGSREVLLTTNLDNDDGLCLDFVQRVQDAVADAGPAALYIGQGLIQRGHRLYLRQDPFNAFCSVAAPWSEPETCWMDWHNRLSEHLPVIGIGGKPGWLQVIHGSNVSNRVRGRRVGPGAYARDFAGGLHDAAAPRGWESLGEQFILRPARVLKEVLRRSAKEAIIALGGRDLLGRAKEWAGKYSPARR